MTSSPSAIGLEVPEEAFLRILRIRPATALRKGQDVARPSFCMGGRMAGRMMSCELTQWFRASFLLLCTSREGLSGEGRTLPDEALLVTDACRRRMDDTEGRLTVGHVGPLRAVAHQATL